MLSNALIVSAALIALQGAFASQPTSNIIDLSVLESAPPPPHDLDITRDHPLELYNIAYNSSWVITNYEGTSHPVWAHVSRLPPLIESPIAQRRRRDGGNGSGGDGSGGNGKGKNTIWVEVEPDTGGSSECPNADADHALELQCIMNLVSSSSGRLITSYRIGEAGPSGQSGIWLFPGSSCSGDAEYNIRALEACINTPKFKSILWSSW